MNVDTIIDGAVRTHALDQVASVLRMMHAQADRPTAMHKGMRMALSSALDRVLLMQQTTVVEPNFSAALYAASHELLELLDTAITHGHLPTWQARRRDLCKRLKDLES